MAGNVYVYAQQERREKRIYRKIDIELLSGLWGLIIHIWKEKKEFSQNSRGIPAEVSKKNSEKGHLEQK